MTPTHVTNRHKKKYYYYRCSKPNRHHKKYAKCLTKFIRFEVLDEMIVEYLNGFTLLPGFSAVENRILKHNNQIDQQADVVRQQISEHEQKMRDIKANKDKYLDSLITSHFSSTERDRINDRLSELDKEERQQASQILQLQYELNQITDQMIGITPFKESLVKFRAESESYSVNKTRTFLKDLIESIHYFPDKLIIKFRRLPWNEVYLIEEDTG